MLQAICSSRTNFLSVVALRCWVDRGSYKGS
jgi:hypothetical protein